MNKKKIMLVTLTLLVSIMMFGLSATATAAATRWVNNNKPTGTPPGTSCDNPGYKQIQDAVNASAPGDLINVCAGTYPEQVSVLAGKDNLTLRSVTPLAAIIQAPPTIGADVVNFKSIVRITTSHNVTLLAFTITGPGPFGCDSIRYGVRVDGGGSANILNNHITEIRDTPFSGCQNGVAILVGRQFESQTGSAVILGNLIDKYQKNGPTVDNFGSSAVIAGNTIIGAGATPITAQNGIQISRGASAEVRQNRVRDNAYIVPLHLPEFTAAGILLYQAGTVVTDRNELRRNQDGIDLITLPVGNATVSNNTVIGGIPPFNPALGTLTLGDGIFADTDTANNRIRRNFLRDNREHDCHDDSVGPNNPPALVANIWRDNNGLTENRPGLCRERGDNDDNDRDGDHDRGNDDRNVGNSNGKQISTQAAVSRPRANPID
ncbi:MAG: right-handed parallel beta-helix repeat-containing protein [Acidobacteriota bacterium]|nr:right-handed parallel beta-helix repeat-containing protein [Acidobacteriota bacterium]